MLCWPEIPRAGPCACPVTMLALFRKGTSGKPAAGHPSRLAVADDSDLVLKRKYFNGVLVSD